LCNNGDNKEEKETTFPGRVSGDTQTDLGDVDVLIHGTNSFQGRFFYSINEHN